MYVNDYGAVNPETGERYTSLAEAGLLGGKGVALPLVGNVSLPVLGVAVAGIAFLFLRRRRSGRRRR